MHRLQEGLLEAVAVGAEQVDGLAYCLPHLLVLQSLVIGHVVRQLAAQGDKHVGSGDIHVHVQCTVYIHVHVHVNGIMQGKCIHQSNH